MDTAVAISIVTALIAALSLLVAAGALTYARRADARAERADHRAEQADQRSQLAHVSASYLGYIEQDGTEVHPPDPTDEDYWPAMFGVPDPARPRSTESSGSA